MERPRPALWPQLVSVAVALSIALWIALGRLYLGVHWPSDVLAGLALGGLQTAPPEASTPSRLRSGRRRVAETSSRASTT